MKKYVGIGFDQDGINIFLYNNCIRFAWFTHFVKHPKFFIYYKDELERCLENNLIGFDFFIGLTFNI